MTRPELLKLHEELCNEARKLMEQKNHDYAGGPKTTTPFLNFQRVEAMGIMSTELGFLVRMTDKMSRLTIFCQEGTFEVQDESLRDTILDVINYGVLLYGYILSKSVEEQRGN